MMELPFFIAVRGSSCKLVHVDVEFLFSLEEAVQYAINKMSENVDKLHHNRKLTNYCSDHANNVNMCLVL